MAKEIIPTRSRNRSRPRTGSPGRVPQLSSRGPCTPRASAPSPRGYRSHRLEQHLADALLLAAVALPPPRLQSIPAPSVPAPASALDDDRCPRQYRRRRRAPSHRIESPPDASRHHHRRSRTPGDRFPYAHRTPRCVERIQLPPYDREFTSSSPGRAHAAPSLGLLEQHRRSRASARSLATTRASRWHVISQRAPGVDSPNDQRATHGGHRSRSEALPCRGMRSTATRRRKKSPLAGRRSTCLSASARRVGRAGRAVGCMTSSSARRGRGAWPRARRRDRALVLVVGSGCPRSGSTLSDGPGCAARCSVSCEAAGVSPGQFGPTRELGASAAVAGGCDHVARGRAERVRVLVGGGEDLEYPLAQGFTLAARAEDGPAGDRERVVFLLVDVGLCDGAVKARQS